jgi:carboxyl-terminal processing protease
MRGKLRQLGILALGMSMGVLIAVELPAVAQPGQKPLPIEELRAFTEVFGKIKSDYVEPVDDKKLIDQAIAGMLSGLDPHSSYLDKEAFREMQVGTRGEFGGLGIEVGMEDGFVKVVAPIDDSPASRAGIKAGDLIMKLDETFVKGITLNDAVKLMRGKPDTSITLTVARKGETKPLVFALKRAVINSKRQSDAARTRLCVFPRLPVPGPDGRSARRRNSECVQTKCRPDERYRARFAQRSGRPLERRRCRVGRVPAEERPGRVYGRPH